MEQNEFIKKLNMYFHDIEADYFVDRHRFRFKNEAKLYRNFFRKHSKKFPSGNIRILELATGTGFVPKILLSFDWSPVYICTDISLSMLDKMKKSNRFSHKEFLHYVICDSERTPFKKESFDLVICNASMHHFPDIQNFCLEVDRVLNGQGIAIIGHEPNRLFWTNRAISLLYRLLQKIQTISRKKSNSLKLDYDYKIICQRLNNRLLKNGLIKEPLSTETILGYVDIHSPNSGKKIDYSRGFIVKEIKRNFFKDYILKDLRYHYHGENLNRKGFINRLFEVYNRVFFPNSAPSFSLILEKPINKN